MNNAPPTSATPAPTRPIGSVCEAVAPPAIWTDQDTGQVGHRVHVWPYVQAHDGALLGYAVRYETADGRKFVIPFFKQTPQGRLLAGAPAEPRPLFGLDTLDRPGPIFVVEGEKDAAALQALGFAALTSQGGSQAGDKADWEPVAHAAAQGRAVLVWPDQDAPGRAYAATVTRLIGPGCRCLIVRPEGTPDRPGAGAADWLHAQLVALGTDWNGLTRPDLADTQRQGLRARLLEAVAAIQGPPPPDWASRPRQRHGTRPRGINTAPKTYVVTEQGIFRLTHAAHGEPAQQQLANFTARIQEEVTRDDGQERTLTLTLAGTLAGRRLPAVTLTIEQFARMDWPTRYWGTATLMHPGPGAKDHLKYAIQLLSHQDDPPVVTRTLFTHTGWRQLDGDWLYLSAGAVIGVEGAITGVEVDLGELGERYRLPAPSLTVSHQFEAAAASAASASVAPPEVAIPLIAAVYLAPLAQHLAVDFALWLEGPSRSLKSTLAALMAAHFGAGMERTTLAASWLDTPNAIGLKLFMLADTLTVIDDYAPQPSAGDQARLDKTVATIIRGIGNRAGRGRLTADIRLQHERKPRALVLCTAEQWPTGESINARLFGVPLRPGQLDLERLSRSQTAARQGLLARAMADYLHRLASSFDARCRELTAEWEDWRAVALKMGLSGRTPEQAAFLLIGYGLAVEHWHGAGVLTAEQAHTALETARRVIFELARQHERRIAHAQPADVFLTILCDLLLSGAVHLRDMNDGRPTRQAASYGWKSDQPEGPQIGWVNEPKQEIYLLPTPTFEAVYSCSRRIETPLNLRPTALKRQLLDRGFLLAGTPEVRGDKTVDRTTRKVRIGHRSAAVLVFSLGMLDRQADHD